jgi:hypothetical protein
MNDRDGQGGKRLSKTTGRDGSNRQPSEKPTDTMSRGPTRQNWMMTPDIQNKIGQQLRAVYSDIVDQGVPDRFAKLIDQLEGQTRNSGSDLPDGQTQHDRPDRQAKNKSNEPD